MKMKYFVPAFLAVSLVTGAAFSSDAFSRSHNNETGGYNCGQGYSDSGYGHKGDGYGHKGNGKHFGKNGMHKGYNLNDKDRAEYEAMRNKHQEKMHPLRAEHFVKSQELQALQNATNPDVGAVNKASKELVDIKQKLMQERQGFNATVDKKFESK